MARKLILENLMKLASGIGANPNKFMGTRSNITFLGKAKISFLNIAWNYLYFAIVRKNNSKPIDSNEVISVYEVSIEEMHKIIKDGEILHSSTMNAFFLAKFLNLIK